MPPRLAALWWSIGAALVVIDAYFSLVPPGEGTSPIPDKLVHFATYFLLGAWFVALAVKRRLAALIGVIALGGALELLQGLTPQRQPEWLDLLANSAGALLAFPLVKSLPQNPFLWFEKRVLRTEP